MRCKVGGLWWKGGGGGGGGEGVVVIETADRYSEAELRVDTLVNSLPSFCFGVATSSVFLWTPMCR